MVAILNGGDDEHDALESALLGVRLRLIAVALFCFVIISGYS